MDFENELSAALNTYVGSDPRFTRLRRTLADTRAMTEQDGDDLIGVATRGAHGFGADVIVNYLHGTFAADLLRYAAEQGIPSAEMAPTMEALAESMAALRALLKRDEVCA